MAFFVNPSREVGTKILLSMAAIEKRSKKAPMRGQLGQDEDSIAADSFLWEEDEGGANPSGGSFAGCSKQREVQADEQLVGVIPHS